MIIVCCSCCFLNEKDKKHQSIDALVLEIKPQIVAPSLNSHHTSFRYLIKTDKGFFAIDTFFNARKSKYQTYAYGLKEGKKYHFNVKGINIPFMTQYIPRYITSY